MPAKSRHGRGKHRHQSKKSKAMQRQVTAAVTPPATVTSVEAPAAAAPPPKITPTPKTARTTAKTMAIDYSYVSGELKRIGIMAVIAIVILFILSVFIS
jgi:hypothetical protein